MIPTRSSEDLKAQNTLGRGDFLAVTRDDIYMINLRCPEKRVKMLNVSSRFLKSIYTILYNTQRIRKVNHHSFSRMYRETAEIPPKVDVKGSYS